MARAPHGVGFITAGYSLTRTPRDANALRPTSRSVDPECHTRLHVSYPAREGERTPMSDRYQSLIHTPVGQLLAKNLGLPNPTRLERWTEGAPLVTGSVGVGGDGRLGKALVTTLDELGIASVQNPPADQRYKGLVFDATGITSSDRLAELQEFFTPLLRSLETCPRVVVLGTPPESTNSAEERVAQRALEGFTRSLGKEVGRGGTVQLVYVAPASDGALTSTLAFLLSPKSAYVSGQVVRIGSHGATAEADNVTDWDKPQAGQVAIVTGDSSGSGAQIARVLTRDRVK